MRSTPPFTAPHRPTTRLRSLLTRRTNADLAARRALGRELAQYRSSADLLDLAATLRRHGDAETADIRDLVDWSAAA